MTAGIKRMLAEQRQAREAKGRVFEPNTPLLEMIDKAAPFIDEGTPMDKWPPSALLKIGYFILATGESGPKRAAIFVLKRLDLARARFVAGQHPNPFLGAVE